MATIKSYTDLKQSKKLAEILPLESADMYWSFGNIKFMDDDYEPNVVQHIPCWSLAALLEVIKIYTMQTTYRGTVFVEHEEVVTIHRFITREYTWCVDACVEMIEWMNMNHLL